MYSVSVWYNLHCKTGKGGKIVLIETIIYKCEYCGAEFDDEYEANCHEWVCRYKDVKKQDSCLYFYNEEGARIKFNDQFLVDEVEVFTVGNKYGAKFITELFDWQGYDNPFRLIANDENPNYCGIWYFDIYRNYGEGEWVRVDDQIKKWTDIKNKFENNA